MNDDERFVTICGPSFKRIEEGNAQILKILQGTEDRPGLTERLRRVEDGQEEHEKTLKDHHYVLFGQGREKTGLVDDIRQQQLRQDRASKLVWTAICAAIVQAVVWIVRVFTGGKG
jgi:hypothetical protein